MQSERLILLIVGSILFVIWIFSDKSYQTLTEWEKRLPWKYRKMREDPATTLLITALACLLLGAYPELWK